MNSQQNTRILHPRRLLSALGVALAGFTVVALVFLASGRQAAVPAECRDSVYVLAGSSSNRCAPGQTIDVTRDGYWVVVTCRCTRTETSVELQP